jgi:hypothetical protein
MRYKHDWDKAKERLTAFWDREIIDRCCCAVFAHEQGYGSMRSDPPADPSARLAYWTDPEQIISRYRRRMEGTVYGGEAFPQIFIDLGAGGHAGFFKGAKYQFEDTVWFFPSHDDPDAISFDANSFLFERTMALARAYAADSGGDYIVSMPDCTGNADALSHLFGPETLLPLMLEEPDAVLRAFQKVEAAYEAAMRGVYDIVKDNNGGGSSIGWMSTWAPGMHAQMQADLSVMISNEMFEQFIMPELRAQCDFLDYPLYHLDGVEQLRHLDSLLSLEKLRAIQWTQVTGQKPCTEYIPELRRIQEAGKGLLILVSPAQIRPLMENLSSRGLYLITAVNTKEDAEAILREVSKLTHD